MVTELTNKVFKIHHQRRERRCRVIKLASKASRKKGEPIWWLEVLEEDRKDLSGYYWRVMKPERLLVTEVN